MTSIPPPPPVVLAVPTLDFETYSEAGYMRNLSTGGWDKVGPKGGIADVGAWCYSRHPSTEVIWLAYDLCDGRGVRSWFPWLPAPIDLFDYVSAGGVLEAWNSFFEYSIWNNVFTRQCGAPPLPVTQLRDAAAAGAAFGLPRSLEDAGKVLGAAVLKDTIAAKQVKKLWIPRKPTKSDQSTRLTLEAQTELHMLNGAYCETDVASEMAIAAMIPQLSPYELEVWKADQRINARGVAIDYEAVQDALDVIAQMRAKYVPMMPVLTNGEVGTPNSHAALRKWVCDQGVEIPDTQADTIAEVLERDDIPQHVRDVLDIRELVGGAAINKVFAMDRYADPADHRARGVFMYHGAGTARWASRGLQLHNNPNSGPEHYKCAACNEHFIASLTACPHCGIPITPGQRADEWDASAAESIIKLLKLRSLGELERCWGNALKAITACIRGFLVAAPGHELICADYSAIEARVIAVLAGEEWRLDVFKTHGKIYEASACQMFGMTMDDFVQHKKEHGSHHPARKKGKVSELALGYQGGVNAMAKFGADKFMTRDEMKDTVKNWRLASPNVCALWYALEENAVAAVRSQGQVFTYRYISYQRRGNVLYCKLPSGREIAYQSPTIEQVYVRWESTGVILPDGSEERTRCEYPWPIEGSRIGYKLFYMAADKGRWAKCSLYGGLLVENATQAVARDLLAGAILRLEAAGYPVVMHVHDEVICEVPTGFGSPKELEAIMEQNPSWAHDWPIKADGGWRGLRYRK